MANSDGELNSAQCEFGDIALKCPECEETSSAADWEDCYTYCDICGDHAAVQCPRCQKTYECVWGYDEIREANKLAD